MAGPHSPNHTVGGQGPTPPSESQPLEFPDHPNAGDTGYAAAPQAPPGSANYAGPPPAPAPYPPRRSKRRLIVGLVLAVALVAVMTVAIVYGVRTNGANTGATFSEGAAKTAIQGYLDAPSIATSTRSPATPCAASTTASRTSGPTRRWPSSAATRSANSSPRCR